jgi:hypothetical protein
LKTRVEHGQEPASLALVELELSGLQGLLEDE